jgi:hypothetical protein
VTGAFSKAGRLIRRAAPKLTDRKINHIEFKILENRAVSIGRCNTGLKFTSGEIEGDREGQHTYGSSSGDREFIVRRDWYFQNCFLKVPVPSDAQILTHKFDAQIPGPAH